MADVREPRVLIDATAIPSNRGGVGRYVDSLVRAIDREGLIVVCQDRDADGFRAGAPHAVIVPQAGITSPALRFLWEQLVLPRIAHRYAVDVIHSPHYTIPLAFGGRRVVVFHDMTFFSDRALHSRTKAIFFRWWIRLSSRRADRIICVSHATAEVLETVTAVRPAIDIVHLGVDHDRFAPPDPEAVAVFAAWSESSRWIAFLGTLEPRKNVPELIRAVRALRRDGTDVPPLLLAGGSGWDPEVDAELLRTPPDVARRLGYIPADQLAAFLGGASVVAYPSLGEGFGLPVLEAMACGGVVLTTDRLSLPEVGGDAVAYAGTDADAIAAALRGLLEDGNRRRELSRRALARSREFTWMATAKETESAWRRSLE